MRPCQFCPRATMPLAKGPHGNSETIEGAGSGWGRLGIPVFRNRVSPVLDTCTRLVVIDFQGHPDGLRREVGLGGASLAERVRKAADLGVELVICASTSQRLYNLLKGAGIELMTGIVGDIDHVLQAFKEGRLGDPAFRMPGFSSLHALLEISQHDPSQPQPPE